LREWGIIPPQTDIGSPYTPEWGKQWSGFGWAGFVAPASLAPFYAWSMVQRAYRAGYIPTDWAEQPSGGYGMFTYAGRAGQAETQSVKYQLRQELAWPSATQYNASQAMLWAGRANYWELQQNLTPMAEVWSAAKLLSYVSPEAYTIRALGFPFYGGIQTMLAGYAQAPYVQAAIALDPSARTRMNQSSMFFAGQYPSLAEELIGGVGEWTFAQMLGWGAMAPAGQRLVSLKSALPISLIQPGLQMLLDPLATMAVRSAWGEPMFYNEAERRTAAIDLLTGAGLVGGGTYLWARQISAGKQLASPFGVPWGAVVKGETFGPYNMTVADVFRARATMESVGILVDPLTGIQFKSLPEEVRLAAYQDRLGKPFGYRQITENEYRIFVGEFGDRYPTLEEGRYGETFFGKGYGRGMWAEGFTEGEAVIMGFRPSLGLESGLSVIGSLAGIPAFWGAEKILSTIAPNLTFMGKPLTKTEQEVLTEAGAIIAGFGGSYAGAQFMSGFAPALEDLIYAAAPSWAPAIGAASGAIALGADIIFPILIGTWAISEMIGPSTSMQAHELSTKYSLSELTQMYQKAEASPGGWNGVPQGETLRQSLIAAMVSKPGGAEAVYSLLGFGFNVPRDVMTRYIAERNPDIMKFLDPSYANIGRSTSYLYSPISQDLSKLPVGVLDRYIAERNPDVMSYLTNADWRAYYGRHPELQTTPFTNAEIAGMPSSIQTRYLVEGNPNYLSYYYGPGGPVETAYWQTRAARESVWTYWTVTDTTMPNPFAFGSAEYYAWENANPLATRAHELIEQKVPWAYYGPSVTGGPTGYWAPDVTYAQITLSQYPVGSSQWAAVINEWASAAGYWGTPGQPVSMKAGDTAKAIAEGRWKTQGGWRTAPPGTPESPTGVGVQIIWDPVQLLWTPNYTGGGYANEVSREEWAAKYGPEAAYPVSYRPHGGGGGGGGRQYTWKPWTHEEQVTKLEGYNVEYNYLRYPWMESWAAELGIELAKSPQGRYGEWWGGYWQEGMTYEQWQRKQWEFEKGRYALGAGAPSIETMSGEVDSMMIQDEVRFFAENGDLADIIGESFYRIQRETQ